MTMLKSYDNDLFTSIFPNRAQCTSLIIKLLLVLETENLIPLFELDSSLEDNKLHSGISASVINSKNKIESVKDIILQFRNNINPLTLFFGSNFQIELKENFSNSVYGSLTFNSFLIFTQQGLIVEYPEVDKHCTNNALSHHWKSGRYNLLFWEDWQEISINFADEKPECTLIFTNKEGHYLKINKKSNNESEVQQIEQQLPLVFCYFIMKSFWKYIEKLHSHSFPIFNPDDFLYLDQDRLAYFTTEVLDKINITEEDLDSLVRKIDTNKQMNKFN